MKEEFFISLISKENVDNNIQQFVFITVIANSKKKAQSSALKKYKKYIISCISKKTDLKKTLDKYQFLLK